MAAAGILANGVTEILKKLSSVLANEITLVWDFKDEIKNLQSTILAVMEDAENKQVSDAVVRLWMEELKAIAYDEDDILDEIIRQRGKVRKPSLIFCWKMAHRIRNINEKFNKIAKRKNDLGLQTINLSSSSTYVMMNRATYSFVDDSKIVGRENAKSTIINMLLAEEKSCSIVINQGGGERVSVIPIVGMGGLGKTTLAQLVYNDEAVKRHFKIRIWIFVSDDFNVKKLLRNIVNSIGMVKQYDDAITMDDIVRGLQDDFRGNKFLIVLDDVWNKNHEDWDKFKKRSVKVASIMGDKFSPYHLGILNESDCCSLFKERAFGTVADGVDENPNLVAIGK